MLHVENGTWAVIYCPEGVLEKGWGDEVMGDRERDDDDVDTTTIYHTADSFEIGAIYASVDIPFRQTHKRPRNRILDGPYIYAVCQHAIKAVSSMSAWAAAICPSTCIYSINTRSRQTDSSSTVDASSRMVHWSSMCNTPGSLGYNPKNKNSISQRRFLPWRDVPPYRATFSLPLLVTAEPLSHHRSSPHRVPFPFSPSLPLATTSHQYRISDKLIFFPIKGHATKPPEVGSVGLEHGMFQVI